MFHTYSKQRWVWNLKLESSFNFFLASGVTVCKVINRFEHFYRNPWLVVHTMLGRFSGGFS